MSDMKQVIVVRTHYPDGKGGSRRMHWGKLMAQVAHASMKVFFDRITATTGRDFIKEPSIIALLYDDGRAPLEDIARATPMGPDDVTVISIPLTDDMVEWVEGKFTKIILSVETEADLLRVHELALEANIPTCLITDAGKTEFKKPCETCEETGWEDCVKCDGEGCVPGGDSLGLLKEGGCDGGRMACRICGGDGRVGVPTHTTVALGPARAELIDRITGPDGLVICKLA